MIQLDWEDKVWGHVTHVFYSPRVGTSLLLTKRGFRCSRHHHAHRSNEFVVLSGKIEVWEWYDYDSMLDSPKCPDVRHVLESGCRVTVPAMRPHMFAVITSGMVLEIYGQDGGEVDKDDIVRFDVGGEHHG